MNEYIKHDRGNDDAWVCLCGNSPSDDGFYPVGESDNEVEPTQEEWKTGEYFCNRCGRVIDQHTLQVVRRLDPKQIARLA